MSGQKNGAIDMRMNWQHAAQLMLAVLADGTPQGKREARAEIMKMARAADAANSAAYLVGRFLSIDWTNGPAAPTALIKEARELQRQIGRTA